VERPTLPLTEEEALFLNTHISRRKQKAWSWISRGPENRNVRVDEGQQQSNPPIDSGNKKKSFE
jgi:hypothetical protein